MNESLRHIPLNRMSSPEIDFYQIDFHNSFIFHQKIIIFIFDPIF